MVFASSHVWMWDHKKGWVSKNWCFPNVVLKTLESPLESKEIKLVTFKGNQPWIFIGMTDAEHPIFCPPYAKSQLIGNDSDAGKDWGQVEMGWRRMRWLDGITDSMDVRWGRLRELVKERESCLLQFTRLQRVRHNLATEQKKVIIISLFLYGNYYTNVQRRWAY